MMRPGAASHFVARVGLVVGLALLAGALLTVSIAVSAAPVANPRPPRSPVQPKVGTTSEVFSPAKFFGAKGSADPAEAVRRAWERARDAGAYHLTTDLVQLLYPAHAIASAGSTPQREELHLEGDVDLAAQAMDLKLWQGGGSVAVPGDGAELRVERGKAYIRRLAGGTWQETADLSTTFAPGSDALALLAGIKGVREAPAAGPLAGGAVENASAFHGSRFAFQLDGPALARYLRDRLEAQLAEQGKLPLGVDLDTPQQYRDATGNGELWLDAAGLPLRLSVHLVYPEARNGSHVEADIKTDFSGFPAHLAVAPSLFKQPVDWAAAAVSPAQHPAEWTAAGRLLLMLALCAAALALLLVPRRSRKVYATVVVTVILSMIVAPLLQADRVVAFSQEQAAKQAEQDQQLQAEEAARQVQAELAGPAFDPHRDPLAQPAAGIEAVPTPGPQVAPGQGPRSVTSAQLVDDPPEEPDCTGKDTDDSDGDGINNLEECKRGLNPDNQDQDGDELLDGLEVYQLGTEPTLSDTDADWITDTLEIRGYPYGDNTWYLNPLKADTDGDGAADSVECPELLGVALANASTFDISTCDTDRDGTPDPWDLDSDNDGVPDIQDLSPVKWVDQDGYHPTAAEDGSITAFTAPAIPPGAVDPRFSFTVQDLQTTRPWPVLVDLQLRPVNPEHLNYALSILDWPNTIPDGQIQHVKTTTFADLPKTRITDDEAAAHGDMQLVPMLEVEMNGNTVPLTLAPASATVQVGTGALSTTITLEPASSTTTKLTITPAGPKPAVKIYSGACLNKGTAVDPSPTLPDVFTGRMVDLADGSHVIEVSDASGSACAEIPDIVNGPYTDKMVDLSVLKPYGISVQELGSGSTSTTLLMYVPVNLVSDDTGGGRTAFAAHLVYYPGSTTIPIQYVKLVWAVQAITDQCDTSDPDFPKNLEEYQEFTGNDEAKQEDYDAYYRTYCLDTAHRTADSPEVVQTYDDSWYLTGMNIREDHGLVVAAAYENPATYPTPYAAPEEDLWQLSLGLAGSFLSQRDCEKPTAAPPVIYDAGNAPSYDPAKGICSDDGLRDVTVAKKDPLGATVIGNSTISERFDAATDQNFYYTKADQFGSPLDALSVLTEQYEYQDQIVEVATRQTTPILEQLTKKYAVPAGSDPTFTPTILYAREEYFRSANLDAGTFNSRLLTVKVAGGEQLLTAMNWETFRYNPDSDPFTGEVIGWEGIPLSELWENLQEQFAVYFEGLYHPTTEEERQANGGRVKIALSYYLALTQGLVNVADPCPGLTCKIKPAGNSSVDMAKGIQAAVKGVANVIRVALEEMMAWTARAGIVVKDLEILRILELKGGGILKGIGPLSVVGPGGFGKYIGVATFAVGLVVAGGLACLAILLASELKNGNTVKIMADVMLAAGLVMTGFGVITAVGRMVRQVAESGSWSAMRAAAWSLKTNLGKSWELTKCLTTAVAIAMNFLVFIMQWGSGMAVGSLQWDSALAGAIAGSLGAILMFVIFNALGPIGTLVQACFALVDMVAGLICTLTDAAEKQPAVAYWFCGGLTGLVNNLFKALIYSGHVIVDMSAKNRMEFSGWRYTLVHPEMGMVVGNAIKVSVNITNTITKMPNPTDSLWAYEYWKQWHNDDNLKKATFKYVWKDYDWASVDAQYGAAASLWQPTTEDHTFEMVQPANSTQGFPLNKVGIRSLKAYLTEGYAVPEQECWGIWPAGGCWIHENTGSNAYDIGSSLVFAVLPNSLDGFRTLAAKGRGYAQSWGSIGFPVLYDADNDGLPYNSDGDDHVADRDGDGLLDGYEIEIGSNPAAADSDGDGLPDRFEILAHTDPNLPDTDGDGLKDGEEVGHPDILDTDRDGNKTEWLGGWRYVYKLDETTGAPSVTWVWSDPRSVDADGDTLSDAQERVYGYNPGVKSNLNMLTLDSQLNERDAWGEYTATDGVVLPGQTLYYSSTVTNQLLSREAEGLLSTEADAGISTGGVPDRSFVLRPQEHSTTVGELAVSAAAASGVHNVTQVAGATISDWAGTTGGMLLWLPFNDPSRPFFDRSGHLPPHDGACFQGRGEPGTGCTPDTSGYYGSGMKLDGYSFVGSAAQPPQLGGTVSLWFKTSSTNNHDLLRTPIPTGSDPLRIFINGGVVTSQMGVASGSQSSIDATLGNYPHCADGQWHHVAVTYGKASAGSSAESHKLYVDGQLRGTGTAMQMYLPASQGIDLGGIAGVGTGYSEWLRGSLDDVRVYDRALSPREVAELYGRVAFAMNFDLANPWQDTSGQGATVSCPSGYCPGTSSGSASFNGAQFVTASGSVPNLSGGRLTLAAWIYPQAAADEASNPWYRGILGNHRFGSTTGYPTLDRYGRELRFGFSTGTAWKEVMTSGSVLTLDAWNHVVVTLSQDDGYARIYVNGVERQATSVAPFASIASPATFDIGRSTDQTKLTVVSVRVIATSDAAVKCPPLYAANDPDEICLAYRSPEVGSTAKALAYVQSVCESSNRDSIDKSVTLTGPGGISLDMWEDDVEGDKNAADCGSVCDSDDDAGTLSDNYFAWNEVGNGGNSYPTWTTPKGDGDLKVRLYNTSVPFIGKIDNVQVYNRALTAAEVEELYRPPSLALRLPLDEPPGATVFGQPGGSTIQAGCTHCPTSGVPGRIDRAVQFDGTSQYLSMPNSSVNRLTSGFTIAGWIKPNSITGSHTILATSRATTSNGYLFGTSNNRLHFEGWPPKTGNSFTSQVLSLQSGRWAHVAVAVKAGGGIDFYVDGARETLTGIPDPIAPDTDDNLLVGAHWSPVKTVPDQYFDGLIDDVQIHSQSLTTDQVMVLYNQAPVMHVRLDEPQNAGQFADSARTGVAAECLSPEVCPMAGEAVRGKVGLAAHFDGVDDFLELDDPNAALRLDRFTVGGWVKPSGLKPTPQPILTKSDLNGKAFYILRLQADTGVVELLRGCSPYTAIAGTVPLVANQWSQVLGTYDGQTLRLYVNGVKVKELASALGTCAASGTWPLFIGGDFDPANALAGDLDELIVYNHALSEDEIASLHAYQLSWTEDRENLNITVDRDNPTAEVLLSGTPYFPNAPVAIPLGTADATSKVVGARLCVGLYCSGALAPHCTAPELTAAWCPIFTPSGEGIYQVSAMAEDRVGHTGTSAQREVRVDDTPPVVGFSGGEGDLLNAVRDSNNNWTVHLSGTASDPVLRNTSTPGSGVPPDGVFVTLYRADGGLAGAARQSAAVAGTAWTVDYVLSDSEPSGCYTAEAVAADALAATYPDEAPDHTGTATRSFGIQTAGPAVQIDYGFLTASQSLTSTLAGAASSNFLPVKLSWTTGSGGSQAGITLACHGPGSSDAKYIAYRPGSALEASQNYTWAGQVHRQATCDLTLTAAAGSPGIVSGSATVCGEEVATWTDNQAATYATSFTASSSKCATDLCSGKTLKSNISKVQVAFTPLTPGTPFVNETPPAGEVLHLTMDAGLDGSGNPTFPDVSPSRLTGACSGATCPATGQQGHSGRGALFDGVDDAMTLPNFGAFTRVTASAWIRRTGATTTRETILSYKEHASCGFVLALNADGKSQFPRFWVRIQPASGSAVWQYVEAPSAVPPDAWVQLAGTYDGQTIRLFVNGTQVNSTTAAGTLVQCSATSSVGSQSSNKMHRFPGLIDEVRVFDQALTDSEVKDLLYTGSEPVLVLPFERQWATDGSVQEDTSGWQRDATLVTGTGDTANKAASGQVGGYALQLDGMDDHAVVPDDDPIDFDPSHDFAVTAWIKPAPAQVWTATMDNNVVEKWSGAGGYPYSIRYLNQTAGGNAGKISAGRWDGQNGPWLQSTTRIDDGRFHHVAFVKRGSTLAFYVDGQLHGERADTTTGATTNSSPLYIGRRGGTALQGYFTGSVDDVRIYPRGLPAEEVQELYLAGWRDATLTAGGGTQSARWSVAVPPGLEGSYRVDLRSTDSAGRSKVAPVWITADLSSPAWSGNADNTGPRVTVCGALVSGSTYRYVAVAQDYNLSETGFTFICPITGRSLYQSPWFLAGVPPGTDKLYKLTADCQSNTTAAVQAVACDSSNNCTTANVTTGGVCDGILAAQAAAVLEKARAAAIQVDKPLKPAVAFASTVLTATQLHDPRALIVEGTAIGTEEILSLDLTMGGSTIPAVLSEPAPNWPFTRTWTSTYLLPEGPLPDGVTQLAVATARLQGRRSISTRASLTLDVVPPAAVDLTLTENGSPLAPNAIVRTVHPELTLSWSDSQDGSGLKGYITRWTATSATAVAEATTVTTRTFGPAGSLSDSYAGGEAQQLTVELGSQDMVGNVRWQQAGPVTLDSPRTPDYIPLDAYGWQESGCALMGVDRRLHRLGLSDAPQQLYAAWDSSALRLALSGTSSRLAPGDLFVYLDTGPGGTTQPFVPVALPVLGAAVTLPDTLQADVLIWVQTADEATILRWDGAAWSGATPLPAGQLRFDAGRANGQVDIVLPFEMLGLTPASSLGLIVLGVQEPVEGEAPLLWVTLPPFNPVNSPLVSRLAGIAAGATQFSLKQEYRWTALSDGVCPNGTDGSTPATREGDSDLQVSIEAEPQGAVFGGQANGLFWVTDPQDAVLPAEDSPLLRLLQPRNPPVADGQSLDYTVHYLNRGADIAVGAYVQLAGYGHISGVPATLNLGDVPPGGAGVATFQAVADRSQGLLPIAGVIARVYDASHGPDGPPLDWLSVTHRVDRGAPEAPQLALPSRIGPLREIFRGRVLDESGIREVTLDVQWPGGSRQITCPLVRAADGDWTCDWDAGSPLPHGTPLTVRVQATDSYGQTSPWSAPHTITIDAEPPTTTLDLQASLGAAHAPAVRGALTLFGTAADAGDVIAVTVCLADVPTVGEETCKRADQQPDGGWSYRAPALGALDSVSRTVTIWATDDLGNRTGTPLSREIRIDNVAPVLSADQLTTTLVLGRTATVLSGAATDGGPTVEVSVRVQPPAGDEFRADTLQTGNDWSFDLSATEPGRYTLWVDAGDQAGNRSSVGPFEVDVTCTDAVPIVSTLTAEPSATASAAPVSVTLSTRLINSGADVLPAGVPLTFYARGAATTTLTTTQSLAPGATLDLALDWSPGMDGDWDVVVVPNAGQRKLGDAVLCRIPDAAHFTVGLADVPLFAAWNLISSPVQPDNPDVQVVQRPIRDTYAAILGYEGGLRRYTPLGPDTGDLAAIGAGRGYWVRETLPPLPPDPEEPWQVLPVAALRLAGQRVPATQPLALAEGWNLAGYLPKASVPVMEALGSIKGAYGAVLGFDRTGVSYYPDLDDGYNTLAELRPSAGYWISTTQAITLQFPISADPAETLPAQPAGTLSLGDRLDVIRDAEQAAGVRPTYAWANLYGQANLPDGSPAPISTTLTALANGLPCGATLVTEPGRFGLLACYGDDETTEAVDGARPGDAITVLLDGAPVSLQPLSFNGLPVPAGHAVTWTGLGDRWQVVAGPAPEVDLAVTLSVTPTVAAPGDVITYMLIYTNAGAGTASGVRIDDPLPAEILAPAYQATGAAVEPIAGPEPFAWQVADLASGQGGRIVISGTVDPAVTPPIVITNVVTITAPLEVVPGDNVASVALPVRSEVAPPVRLWLPLIARD